MVGRELALLNRPLEASKGVWQGLTRVAGGAGQAGAAGARGGPRGSAPAEQRRQDHAQEQAQAAQAAVLGAHQLSARTDALPFSMCERASIARKSCSSVSDLLDAA